MRETEENAPGGLRSCQCAVAGTPGPRSSPALGRVPFLPDPCYLLPLCTRRVDETAKCICAFEIVMCRKSRCAEIALSEEFVDNSLTDLRSLVPTELTGGLLADYRRESSQIGIDQPTSHQIPLTSFPLLSIADLRAPASLRLANAQKPKDNRHGNVQKRCRRAVRSN